MKNKKDRQAHQDNTAGDSEQPSSPTERDAAQGEQPHAKRARRTSDEDQNYAKERQFQKRITVLSLIFSGLLLVATTVYAWFAGGQWQAMDASLKEIRQNREIEFRAYIGAKEVTFQARSDNPAFADISLPTVNTGRTQVQGAIEVRKVIEVRDGPPPEDTVIEKPSPASRIAYIPNVPYTLYLGVIPTQVFDVLAKKAEAVANSEPTPTPSPKTSPTPPVPTLKMPEMMTEFGNGWYVYGVINYKDIFGRPHYTKFCSYIKPKTGQPVFCPTFNDSN